MNVDEAPARLHRARKIGVHDDVDNGESSEDNKRRAKRTPPPFSTAFILHRSKSPVMALRSPTPGESLSPNSTAGNVPNARAWFVLGMLCFVYVLNFLDRQLLSILAKPIQDALHVTDGQLGLIGGLYFAFFYCFIAIPVGWLADKTNRVGILSLACAIWSGATMACGFAVNYPQLVIARMTVGFGEAGGVPPSYAIVSDYFPPGRRGTALGIYNLGPPIGTALGIAFGASIAAAFNWRMPLSFWGRGLLRGDRSDRAGARACAWRPRRHSKRSRAEAGFWNTLAMFFSHRALMLAALGSGATQFITYGVGNFTTLFLMREKGMTLSEVALWYALVVGIGMSGGDLSSPAV